MAEKADKPADAELAAKAVGRWANEGGAPAPIDPAEPQASPGLARADKPKTCADATASSPEPPSKDHRKPA